MSNKFKEFFISVIGKDIGEFVTTFTGWLNGKVLEVGEGYIVMEFTNRKDMCNPSGFMHGGVHAAIIDDVIGMTVASLGNEHHFVSVNLNVDFLGNIKEGEKVICRSKVVRKGKQIIHMICEIQDVNGKLLSKASSNMVVSSIKKEY